MGLSGPWFDGPCPAHSLAIFKYTLPELFMYLLTAPTSLTISSLEQNMAYIKLTIVEVYKTFTMCALSSSVCGDYFLESLKWTPKGVLISLASCMLNLDNTWLMYLAWDHNKVLDLLSLLILIPRIYFAVPTSFFANCFNKFCLKFLSFAYLNLQRTSDLYTIKNNNKVTVKLLVVATMICLASSEIAATCKTVKFLVPLFRSLF